VEVGCHCEEYDDDDDDNGNNNNNNNNNKTIIYGVKNASRPGCYFAGNEIFAYKSGQSSWLSQVEQLCHRQPLGAQGHRLRAQGRLRALSDETFSQRQRLFSNSLIYSLYQPSLRLYLFTDLSLRRRL